jgi:hypothetical protein
VDVSGDLRSPPVDIDSQRLFMPFLIHYHYFLAFLPLLVHQYWIPSFQSNAYTSSPPCGVCTSEVAAISGTEITQCGVAIEISQDRAQEESRLTTGTIEIMCNNPYGNSVWLEVIKLHSLSDLSFDDQNRPRK